MTKKRKKASAPTNANNRQETPPAGARGEDIEECVVVGIGASAGGLQAYKRLLASMPTDAGIVLILIQHLDPNHESLMADLLTKSTDMPVTLIEDATSVEPNHVYVIPPDKFIRIENDTLFLDQPVIRRNVRLPIDYFFTSLAAACHERAVGVVLTGTGSDGTEGLRAIKSQGGLTIVEEPQSATYDGMPRSAIASGMVDLALPLDRVAEMIVGYIGHDYVQTPASITLAESAPDDFRAIVDVLKTQTNHDFSNYRPGTLARRIERRMGIRRIASSDAYLDLLRQEQDEVEALFNDMLIGVTCFFRNPQAWEQLSDAVTQSLASIYPGETLRVWVPGCSTGEEAYSMAMMLTDLLQRHQKACELQVFASDLDSRAIEVARHGLYSESATKNLSDEQVQRHFHREGDKLRVRNRLRDCCVFAVQNLLSDPPFSNVDLVSCRNLLIYLEPGIQQRVFEMLHFALKPRGLLFLGSSESPARRKHLFDTWSQPARLYRKREVDLVHSGSYTLDKVSRRASQRASDVSANPDGSRGIVDWSRRALVDEFAPPSVIVNADGIVQYIHGSVLNFMDLPSGEPALDLCATVVEGLKTKVRHALRQARAGTNTVSLIAPRVRRGDTQMKVGVRVQPVSGSGKAGSFWMVSFIEDGAAQTPSQEMAETESGGADSQTVGEAEANELRELSLELQTTRDDLQCTIEELESANEELNASNEEVMSMNEELQSTNEELETSREELQSLNEELITVNGQLHDKIGELEATTDDLTNLLTSTDMATLFLDADLRIRRFTPATTRLMRLCDSDIGRPIDDLALQDIDSKLVDDAREVLRTLAAVQHEVSDGGQRHFMRTITPFRTADLRIQGVVVTYSDVSRLREANLRIERRERQHAVIARLGGATLAGDPPQQLFDQAVRELSDTFDVEFAKVMQIQEDRREMLLVAGIGWTEGCVGKTRVPAGHGSRLGYMLKSGGSLIVEDARKEKRFPVPDLYHDHGVVSGLSVVIGPESEPWGLLGVNSREATAFTEDDVNFITAMAHVLWHGIRRKVEEAEQASIERRLNAFLSNSAIIAWMKDEQGRYTYLNDQYVRNFEIDEDWPGKTDEQLWPAYAENFRRNDRQVMEQGTPIETIEPAQGPDETPRQYLVSKFPFTDIAGRRFVGGLGVDITDRVSAEQALAQNEERLRMAARLAGFGTYFVDLRARKVIWSDELKKILGLEPNDPEPAAGEVPDSVHAGDRARVAAKMAASFDPAGNGEFRDEYRIIGPSGDVRWVLMQGRTLFEGDGAERRAVEAAGVALDVTDRRMNEERLARAQRAAEAANTAKSEFLANMSHEIRTPLTAILGFADILYERLEDSADQACLATIRDNGDHLCQILDDVLDLAKVEAGKLDVRNVNCDPVAIVRECCALLQARSAQQGLELGIEADGELPRSIHTDPRMLRQSLLNLAGNAVKFTEEGGIVVRMRCDRSAQQLTLEVSDSGPGIAADAIDSLFEPFQQLDGGTTRQAEGTGLGLPISRKLIEALGGTIKVRSVLGEGSTFTISLPTGPLDAVDWYAPQDALQDTAAEAPGTTELPSLAGRILAIDDKREVRFLVDEYLRAAGAEVTTASGGKEGLELWGAARAPAFDLIVLDIHMPSMDGMETARRLRAAGCEVPIIGLSANVLPTTLEDCLQAGFNAVIAKPIDRGLLIRTLAARLQQVPTAVSERPDGVAILCVDDHADTLRMQKLLLERRGHRVATAGSGAEALARAAEKKWDAALIDLGLDDMRGDHLLGRLKEASATSDCLFVCLSGQRESDVDWRDMGFDHYLQKPVAIDDIQRVLDGKGPASDP